MQHGKQSSDVLRSTVRHIKAASLQSCWHFGILPASAHVRCEVETGTLL